MDKELVLVKWIDIVSENNWMTKEEAIKWADNNKGIQYTVGWVLKRNKSYILIASTRDEKLNEGFNDFNKIPLKNIIEITFLDKGQKKE